MDALLDALLDTLLDAVQIAWQQLPNVGPLGGVQARTRVAAAGRVKIPGQIAALLHATPGRDWPFTRQKEVDFHPTKDLIDFDWDCLSSPACEYDQKDEDPAVFHPPLSCCSLFLPTPPFA